MKYYHASPRVDLHIIGLDPKSEPFISYRPQYFVYLGSWDYLYDQYFQYAPKTTYYIYEVSLEGLRIDTSPVGEQVRIAEFIKPDQIKFTMKYVNT